MIDLKRHAYNIKKPVASTGYIFIKLILHCSSIIVNNILSCLFRDGFAAVEQALDTVKAGQIC